MFERIPDGGHRRKFHSPASLLALGVVLLQVSADPGVQFHSIDAARAGIRQGPPISVEQFSRIRFMLNGWGMAVRDLNEDGWPDLILGGVPGWGGLHLSAGGPWRFTNAVSLSATNLGRSSIAGVVVSDLDRDGHLDLITSTYDSGILINHGAGRDGFRSGEGVHRPPKGVYWGGMAAADIDQDGRVDLVALGYRQNRSGSQSGLRSAGGADRRLIDAASGGKPPGDPDRFRISATGLVAEMGAASVVLLNRGDGRMVLQDLASIADYGTGGDKALELDWSLSCAFQDINADGLPDLYVCNDYHSPDRLWINRGGGRFEDALRRSLPYTSLYSMGVSFTDINRDGIPDWIVSDMLPRSPVQRILEYDDAFLNERPSELFGPLRQVSRNTLFVSDRSRGKWNEMACLKGLAASGWSWGPVWIDLDGDGLTDLLVPSGYAQNLQDKGRPPGLGPDDLHPTRENGVFAFLQTSDGRFEERSGALGLDRARSITMSVVPCDMDHDGDPDLMVHNFSEPIQLFENRTARRHVCVSLAVQPGGQPLEGTRIRWMKGTRAVSSTWFGGGTYLSSTPPEFHAPMDERATEVQLEVVWPDGRSEVHAFEAGWHRLVAPPSRGGVGGPVPGPASAPMGGPGRAAPYPLIQDLVLPGTNGDHHEDLPMQDHLPLSLARLGWIHRTSGTGAWLSDSGGGSLVRIAPADATTTNWVARLVMKRIDPAPAGFLPGPAIGWLENTYRYGAGPVAGIRRLESDSRTVPIGSVRENGLTRVAGPDEGPWLLGGPGRFGRFPEHPALTLFDPVHGGSKPVGGLPFDGGISDMIWMGSSGVKEGAWMLAEWFGQVWESATPTGSGRWSEVGSPSHRRGTAFVQMALFSGTASGFPGREEVIVAGLGTNNEWVFRADDRLGWLLRKATNEAVFSGLIEFMHDAEGVPMPLIPFKRFPADPEAVPPSDIRDYAMMRGPRIHKAIADSQRVDPSNSMLVKDASGRWQRRRLPMELQVAPILDAAVIPTSGGPAWLITFKETDGHRIFGSPGQEWPAVVFRPDTTGIGGSVVPSADLGFPGLSGEAELVVVTDPGGRTRVLALWTEGRRCRIYGRADP